MSSKSKDQSQRSDSGVKRCRRETEDKENSVGGGGVGLESLMRFLSEPELLNLCSYIKESGVRSPQ